MASTDARPLPLKNVALRVTFPILDADGDLVTGATGLDSEISKDGGTFTDCTNEATEIATASGMYFLDLSSTEMNADTVAIIVKTTSVGAKTTPLVLYPKEAGDVTVLLEPTTHTSAVIPTVTTLTNAVASVTGAVGSVASGGITTASFAAGAINAAAIGDDAITAAKVADGAIDAATFAAGAINAAAIATDAITAAKIAADAIGASELAADAVTEIQSGLATAAALVTAQADLDDIQTRLPAALVSGRIDASVGAMAANTVTATAIAADAITAAKVADGTIDAATFAAGAIDAAAIATDAIGANEFSQAAADKVWATATRALTDKAGFALSAAGVQAIWDALTAALTTVGSIGKLLVDNLNATISSRATPAQVNTEVVDALAVDTYVEPAAVPADTATLAAKLGWLFALSRNKVTQTATTQTLRNDGDSGTIGTSAVSDDSVTFVRDKWS